MKWTSTRLCSGPRPRNTERQDRTMPHVIIKLQSGRSEQQKAEIAEEVTKAIMAGANCAEQWSNRSQLVSKTSRLMTGSRRSMSRTSSKGLTLFTKSPATIRFELRNGCLRAGPRNQASPNWNVCMMLNGFGGERRRCCARRREPACRLSGYKCLIISQSGSGNRSFTPGCSSLAPDDIRMEELS
jgi:hypothetical protein